jgi:hypothetical protein
MTDELGRIWNESIVANRSNILEFAWRVSVKATKKPQAVTYNIENDIGIKIRHYES